VGARQVTCGRAECRQKRKQYTDRGWRERHPEYERERYQATAVATRSRKVYRRRYRAEHPEYVRRNLEYVRAWRARRRFRRQERGLVSSPSGVLRIRLAWKAGLLRIQSVSSTSRDVYVALSE
jgi:hypothetical protein